MNKIINCLKKLLGEENVRKNINIKKYLTFKVDCIAKILIEVYNKNELVTVLQLLDSFDQSYYVLGNGSNVLFKKNYIKNFVVHINEGYSKIYFNNGKYFLSAFSGCKIAKIINKCKNKNFSCLEWAVGIPATIGGAVIMNMGAFNFCIGNQIASVTYYESGKVKTIKNLQGKFNYRNSVFKNKKCVIISVTLMLVKKGKDLIQKEILKYIKMKSTTQPLNYPSCGSIFQNGDDYKVAILIQNCNLKGYTIGGARVSIKHSNFIINYSNAKVDDIINLICLIKKEVYKKFNISIKEEIIIY